jgi:hypothetical protein
VEPHQRLEVFLPKLLAALERNGNSDDIVVMTWKSVMAGAKQPQIKTVEHYRAAWIACATAADILTTLEDGSEAATWFAGLSHRIFEFEENYNARHGHRPLSPAGPEETDAPTGSA